MSKCLSCKKELPAGASFCPGCGKAVEAMEPTRVDEPKKSSDLRSWIITAVIVAILLPFLPLINKGLEPQPKTEARHQPPTREQRVEQGFSSWNGSHRALVEQVKSNLNDPNSFEHVETRYTDHGDSILTVTMRYRAKNSFGAVVPGFVSAKAHIDGHVIEITSIN